MLVVVCAQFAVFVRQTHHLLVMVGKERSIRLARQRQEEVQQEQEHAFVPNINEESKRLAAERAKERKVSCVVQYRKSDIVHY